MLSDEEKEAKLELNRYIYGKNLSKDEIADYLSIIFGLIEKYSKEIEELKEQCKEVVCVPEGTCFMLEAKDIDKKWEDKINTKIEEYEKNKKILEEKKDGVFHSLAEMNKVDRNIKFYDTMINEMKELLEKE